MSNKLIEQIGSVLIASGNVKNCYDPNWRYTLEEVIALIRKHDREALVEAANNLWENKLSNGVTVKMITNYYEGKDDG